LIGIRECTLKIGSRIKTLFCRIAGFFTHLKKRHEKSVIVEGTNKVPEFLKGGSYSIERLAPDQIEEYVEKARLILIRTGKRRTLITYDTLMHKLDCGTGRKFCGDIVRRVSEMELAEGRPKLSAIVIRSDTRMVGGGFFGLPDTPASIKRSKLEEWTNPLLNLEEQDYWQSELKRVYDYWCPELR
jgi:hypothetical protein